MYKVVRIDETVHIAKKGRDTEIAALSYDQVASLLRLSYAQTYASCQGTEFDDTLRLHDTSNKHFTLRHLFVAMSRAKRRDQIDIVP